LEALDFGGGGIKKKGGTAWKRVPQKTCVGLDVRERKKKRDQRELMKAIAGVLKQEGRKRKKEGYKMGVLRKERFNHRGGQGFEQGCCMQGEISFWGSKGGGETWGVGGSHSGEINDNN